MIKYISGKVKYPKLLLLLSIYIITIICFRDKNIYTNLLTLITPLGSSGLFFGGFFYAYGFTAAPATAALLALAKELNYISAGIIGGLGALLGDTIIFLYVKHTFLDEMDTLKKEQAICFIRRTLKTIFGSFSVYIVPLLVGLLIMSPLPTELGIILMASRRKISISNFLLITYILHTVGIFLILLIGSRI